MSNTQVISATTTTPAIPTSFTADIGVAVPVANNLNVVGGAGIETTGVGDTLTIALTGGGAAIDTILTDDGAPAVVPDVNGQVSILGGVGINVTGQSPGNTVTISADGAARGTVTTNDATPTTVLTIAGGATPGTYALDVLVSAFNSSTPAGASISVWGGVRTTGVATTLTGVSDSSANPEAALAGISAALAVSGNNILVQVTGLAATTINWAATARYEFVS